MNKNYVLALSILVLLSGCQKDKNKKTKVKKDAGKKTEAVDKNVNIPLAANEVKSYFDGEDDMKLGEFVLVEDGAEKNKADSKTGAKSGEQVALNEAEDFSWAADQGDNGFKKCHFEFDKYEVKSDDQKNVEADIVAAKKLLAEGKKATFVVEGHSCHAAGSRTYNMVLSEKRAKTVADQMVAAGVPAESIKIVARGQECPEKDKSGNEITGSIDQQQPNRRTEIRALNC